MMTGKQLKNTILQLAIQGKLVPQDPTDEPASALLARIRKEKEQLLKAGKLKKKDLETTPIADDEKPFEIPESWEWVRVSQIMSVRGGKRVPLGSSWTELKTNHIYIRVTDMKNGTIVNHDLRYITEDVYEKIKSYTISKNDLYITVAGTIGAVGLVPDEFDGMNLTENADKLTDITIDKEYIVKCFNSPFIQSQFKALTNQMAQPKLSIRNILSLPFPLPPLAEQQRIVAKIEELMPLVEEYGAAQEKLNRLNGALPEALKKSILQQAIQGKLVPQDANDEPASALLARIRKEKEQLLKAGKLKKKDLETTPISDDEKPFEIPESWEWCRLGDCVSNRAGLAYNKGDLDKKTSDMIRVLRGGNIFYGGWKKEDNDVMIAREFVNDDLLLKKGTFITPAVTSLENMGKTALIDEDLYDTVVGGFVLMLQSFLYENSLLKYLLYFFCSAYYKEYCKSITNKSGQAFYNISRAKLMNLPIPLPPLSEQHRIVTKIEELMAMVEGMK